MRGIAVVILLGTMALVPLWADEKSAPAPVRFAKVDAGKLPTGWKAEQTNEGKGSEWKIVADATAPSGSGYVLAQLAKGPSRLFNLCIAEKTSHKDVEVSVKIKAVAGKIDQGGGVLWRYQDPNNYYVCRYNPLEDNLRVYKVIKGKRIQLGTKEMLTLPAGKWFTLSIRHQGERITCALEGKTHLEVKDTDLGEAGPVGLWTKADAQTHFDELRIQGK